MKITVAGVVFIFSVHVLALWKAVEIGVWLFSNLRFTWGH